MVHHTGHSADVLPGSGQNVLYPFLAFAAVAEKHVRLRDADHIQRCRLEAVGLPPGGHQQIRLHPVAADGPDKIIVRKQGANHPQSAVVLPCRGSGAAAQQQRRRQRRHRACTRYRFMGIPPLYACKIILYRICPNFSSPPLPKTGFFPLRFLFRPRQVEKLADQRVLCHTDGK